MEWSPSPDQKRALDEVGRWHHDGGAPVFKLFGAAGTGKTELARYFAAGVGRAMFAAPTGKAALVMASRGCVGARTIHSLIYTPKDKSRARLLELNEKLNELAPDDAARSKLELEIEQEVKKSKNPSFELNKESDLIGADLLVVDEASMVNGPLAADILSFGIPVLALGDPYQLPPVFGVAPWVNRNLTPDAMIDEPHRFALESPILRYATYVRTGGSDWRRDGDDSTISFVRKGDLTHADMFAHHDVILAGKNDTRRLLNEVARRIMFPQAGPLPVKGDKLICTKNAAEQNLVNGSLLTAFEDAERTGPRRADLVVSVDDERYAALTVHTAPFDDYREPGVLKRTPEWEFRDVNKLDYAYGLTVHKAQGSQWGSVMVIDESRVFRDDARRWLYTAVTRAQTKLTVLQ